MVRQTTNASVAAYPIAPRLCLIVLRGHGLRSVLRVMFIGRDRAWSVLSVLRRNNNDGQTARYQYMSKKCACSNGITRLNTNIMSILVCEGTEGPELRFGDYDTRQDA
jgi:hypothetical protein